MMHRQSLLVNRRFTWHSKTSESDNQMRIPQWCDVIHSIESTEPIDLYVDDKRLSFPVLHFLYPYHPLMLRATRQHPKEFVVNGEFISNEERMMLIAHAQN